ncbi:hypothetical protein AVEN_166025-1 [Araneus ventricosus]|uniref:Uncharacterized protein n=1 Tax=Araneus ventricosus TaxID=182803 RepID=A0A4Y2L6W8_ARAVE|nr:hypothetical protein AVEN_166025-1 [Araneus ventricosus]
MPFLDACLLTKPSQPLECDAMMTHALRLTDVTRFGGQPAVSSLFEVWYFVDVTFPVNGKVTSPQPNLGYFRIDPFKQLTENCFYFHRPIVCLSCHSWFSILSNQTA